jgi:hypothetical protein
MIQLHVRRHTACRIIVYSMTVQLSTKENRCSVNAANGQIVIVIILLLEMTFADYSAIFYCTKIQYESQIRLQLDIIATVTI